jgi:A/G-specific adenine glycosylase
VRDTDAAHNRGLFRAALLAWYDRNARSLPWRRPPGGVRPADPYRIWLSEIMLQQTTVAAAAPYYARFLAAWPRVEDLAAAPLDAVRAAWAGLGYYARARNLHACAKVVAHELAGRFPDTEDALRALPGIGPYTAAAIAAIAFERPANVVDGNVERVMARLFAVETPMPTAKPQIKALAGQLVACDRPGDYAQALMDLGAVVCTPSAPSCDQCPVRALCACAEPDRAQAYPARLAKLAKPERSGVAFALLRGSALLLRRRPENGLLGGMMGLPTTAWVEGALAPGEVQAAAPIAAAWTPVPIRVRHIFTHFSLTLEVWRAQTPADVQVEGRWVRVQDIAQAGLPTVMRKAAAAALDGLRLAPGGP